MRLSVYLCVCVCGTNFAGKRKSILGRDSLCVCVWVWLNARLNVTLCALIKYNFGRLNGVRRRLSDQSLVNCCKLAEGCPMPSKIRNPNVRCGCVQHK